MGVARVKGQQEKHRPFQEALNVMKLMKLTHLCLRILSDGPKNDKTLTSEIEKYYNKGFFKRVKKKKREVKKHHFQHPDSPYLNEGQVASLSQLRVDCHIQGLNAGKWTQSQNREHDSA